MSLLNLPYNNLHINTNKLIITFILLLKESPESYSQYLH